jgi:hypothetical protein
MERLSYIDHACLELLMSWEKQHEATGGSLVMDWESLHAKFRGPNGVGHSISLLHHARHCADADQADVLLVEETDQLLIVQGLRVAIDQ